MTKTNKVLQKQEFISRSVNKEKGKDRRIKLSLEEKDEIRNLYSTGLYTYRRLAFKYGVVVGTIFCVIHPEKYKENLKASRERWKTHKDHYSKSYMKSSRKDIRRWKTKLYHNYLLKFEKTSRKSNFWIKLMKFFSK